MFYAGLDICGFIEARGFNPGKGHPLVFCPEGAWEIEPVDLRFYNQSVKGQPSCRPGLHFLVFTFSRLLSDRGSEP